MSDPTKDMRCGFERDCRRAAISVAFKALAVVAVLAAIVFTLAGCGEQATGVRRAAGQPLDAVGYAAPSFTGNDVPCYLVVNRITGDQWWLVYMGGPGRGAHSWVVLPVIKD